MSRMIVIERADGGVSVMNAEDSADIDAEFEKWQGVADPEWLPASWREVRPSDVPEDRTFRNAWKFQDEKVKVDMPRALEIKKDMIREERKPLLEALDTEFLKAIETGDTAKQAEVVAKKQALRDATIDRRILDARTPEELKAAIPVALEQARRK